MAFVTFFFVFAFVACGMASKQPSETCQSWEKILSPDKKEFIKSHQGFNAKSMYAPYQNCHWNIEVAQNKVAEIEFKTFKLDGTESSCGGDVVQIGSGDNGFEDASTYPDFEFCGAPKGVVAVTGKGRYMTVIFKTDGSKQNIGFSAKVVQRVAPPACPTLKDGVVDFTFNPGFGITCQWYIENSVDLTFGHVSVGDSDTLSIYRTRDFSLLKQMRGDQLNQIGQNVTKGVTSWLVKFTSAPNSFSLSSFYFSFKVVYNCENFEVAHLNDIVGARKGRNDCRKKGSGWDLLIDDMECKHRKLRSFVDTICRKGICGYWIGLMLDEEDRYWMNGKMLKKNEKNWLPMAPNNDGGHQLCTIIHRRKDDYKWADIECEKHFKTFCSRLT